MTSPYPQQTVPGYDFPVICRVCGREDVLWFCNGSQANLDGRGHGQYLWRWTECCGQFMALARPGCDPTLGKPSGPLAAGRLGWSGWVARGWTGVKRAASVVYRWPSGLVRVVAPRAKSTAVRFGVPD